MFLEWESESERSERGSERGMSREGLHVFSEKRAAGVLQAAGLRAQPGIENWGCRKEMLWYQYQHDVTTGLIVGRLNDDIKGDTTLCTQRNGNCDVMIYLWWNREDGRMQCYWKMGRSCVAQCMHTVEILDEPKKQRKMCTGTLHAYGKGVVAAWLSAYIHGWNPGWARKAKKNVQWNPTRLMKKGS